MSWIAAARDRCCNRSNDSCREVGVRARPRMSWIAAARDQCRNRSSNCRQTGDGSSGRGAILAATSVVLSDAGLEVTNACYLGNT